ncbi:T9SS type A sorting domain-containing protein [Polaribacter sejongensis]|nr:T9SS type A sorting domain-containing protein [Polaribacter undariae]UWD31341.1 T9SS type A sorting domain-containing protein [Polaribacter undariae]
MIKYLLKTKLFGGIIRFKFKTPLHLFIVFVLFSLINTNAQCDSPNHTLNSNQTNGYTFQTGITSVTGNVSITNGSGATFEDGAIVCISSKGKLTISSMSANNGSISIYIGDGEVVFSQSASINANLTLTLGTEGILTSTNTISFNGGNNSIYNEGTMNVGSLDFGGNTLNTFDNLGDVNVSSQINASSIGASNFRNQGTMEVNNNFAISDETILVNCGTIVSGSSFNHNGGMVVNTGVFNITSGSLAMGSTSAIFNNYGEFYTSSGDVNLDGTFYNEGYAKVGGKFQGNGSLTGPASNENKTGFVSIGNQSNISGNLGPNLNIGYTFGGGDTHAIQNETVIAPVSYNCDNNGNCNNPMDTEEVCANLDGTIPCTLNDPGTLIGSCINGSDLQFTLNLTGNDKIGSSYTISGTTSTTGIYNTNTVFVIANGADGLDKTITVTDIDDPNCNLTITVSGSASCIDTDKDGVIDSIDLDDDNDGILDSDELNCLSASSYIDLGQSFTQSSTNTTTGSKTSGSQTNLYNLNEVSASFAYQVINSAQWSDGVSSKGPTNNVDGNYIYGQAKNTNFPNGSFYPANSADLSVAIYTITFTEPVYNIEFKWGGLDNSDRADISANLNGINVPLSIKNNSLNAGEYTINEQSIHSTTSAGNAPNNSVIISSASPITQIVIAGGKEDGTSRVSTMQLFELKYCSSPDTDGDGIPDYLDLDSDNDGIPDIVEAGGIDTNGDGLVDYPTAGDPTSIVDLDGDGLSDMYDDTDTAGGTPNWVAGTPIANPDSDGDGIPDYLDLDSDNDGIPDLVEAGGIDTNGDGRVDNLTDIDQDGLADIHDENASNGSGDSGTALIKTDAAGNMIGGDGTSVDTDNDGIADHLDLDADNDGITDLMEAGGTDTNGDGRVDNNTDEDKDGLVDIYDENAADGPGADGTNGTALVQTDADGNMVSGNGSSIDTDSDGIPDHLDLDSDNDGIPDLVEAGGLDTDGNGHVDTSTDADKDGLVDTYDENAADGPGADGTNGTALIKTGLDGNTSGGDGESIDADSDGIPDHLDLDSDNDGIADIVEAGGVDTNGDGKVDDINPKTSQLLNDLDGDGLDDLYDVNSGTNTNAITYPDSDNDGIPDTKDLDSDNDGITDVIEAGGLDTNRDGIADDFVDTDNDGFNDLVDGDVGQDGTSENIDNVLIITGEDTGSDGTPNSYPSGDNDGDGKLNHIDIDADNDGIPDNIEAQTTSGYIAPSNPNGAMLDANKNGVDDNYEVGGIGLIPVNTDNKDNPDYLDSDSDNDGIPDIAENGDSENNAIIDINADTDGDGLNDIFDDNNDPENARVTVNDGSSTLNKVTTPSDLETAFGDEDNDFPENGDLDYRDIKDTDNDGVPDFYDLDDDNDGILDTDEGCGNLIINGDFELQDFSSATEFPNPINPGATDTYGTFIGKKFNTNTLTGWSYTQNLDGWVGGQSPSWSTSNYADAYSGNQYIDVLGNNDKSDGGLSNILSQTISTVPGNTYTLSFYWGEDIGHEAGQDVTLNVKVKDASSSNILDKTLTAIAEGAVNGVVGPKKWYHFTTVFVATTTETSLEFQASPPVPGSIGIGAALDLVSIFSNNCEDTDNDGIPNSLDLDSDNDGIPDLIEAGGEDTDGNGLVDDINDDGTLINDTNNDGLDDRYDVNNGGIAITNPDTDGDGIPDTLDLDSDNDGIPDVVEAGGTDNDGDGRADNFIDTDNDGFNDLVDGDVNGTTDDTKALIITGEDGNNDGIPDSYPNGDTDGDGILDNKDLDADNDGIPDLIEAGGIDTNGDGRVDEDTDVDNDGLADIYDTDASDGPGLDGTNGNALVKTDASGNMVDGDDNSVDTDGDGFPDHLDLDADNDGIPDLIEAGGVDINGDGRVDINLDADKDGLADIYDTDASDGPGLDGTNGNALVKTNDSGNMIGGNGNTVDTDGDGIPNHLDLDSDNDGIVDIIEAGGTDTNKDGKVEPTKDNDNDGFDDALDGNVNGTENSSNALITTGTGTNNDGIADTYTKGDADSDKLPNFLDIDADNDGIPDNIEGQTTAGYVSPSDKGTAMADTDKDGIDDRYDIDCTGANCAGVTGVYIIPENTDDTDNPDYLDLDSDNDNIPDIAENGHLLDVASGKDDDNDGLDNAFDDNDDSDIAGSTVNDGSGDGDKVTNTSILDTSLEDAFGDEDNDVNTGGDLDYRDIPEAANVMITQVYHLGNEKWIEITNISASTILANSVKIHLFKDKIGDQTNIAPNASYILTTPLLAGKSVLFRNSSNTLTPELVTGRTIVDNDALTDLDDTINDIIILSASNGVYSWDHRYDVVSNVTNNTSVVRIDESLTTNKDYNANDWVVFIDDAITPFQLVGETDVTGTKRHPQDPLISEITSSNVESNTLLGLHRIDITTSTNSNNVYTNGYPDRSRSVVIDQNFEHSEDRLSARKLRVNASKKLTVTDQLLVVTNDITLDGDIRLAGTLAQLVQTHTGTSTITSSVSGTMGNLLVDQNSEIPSLYRYGYMSSPVNSGVNNYTIEGVLRDGTAPSNPKEITFIDGYDGSFTSTGISLADYWIYTYAPGSDGRSDWAHQYKSGTINRGEGYIFKGPGRAQNYTFSGTPNDGDFSTTSKIASGESYLIGNPYPSAMNTKKFIQDNLANTTGTLYFWEHHESVLGEGDGIAGHVFGGYIGGYATINFVTGVAADRIENLSINNDSGTSGLGDQEYKEPLPYIAMGQGFFIEGDAVIETPQAVNFNNSQRAYVTEGDESVFFKTSKKSSKTASTTNLLPIIKLGFEYKNTEETLLHHQIAVSFQGTNSFDFDKGYDSQVYQIGNTDIYWKFPNDDNNYVIAGVQGISNELEVPLELVMDYSGQVNLMVDEIQNVSRDIYITDKLTGTSYDVKNEKITLTLEKGVYTDRFVLNFTENAALSVDDEILATSTNIYADNENNNIVVSKDGDVEINKVEMFDILGKKVSVWEIKEQKNTYQLEIKKQIPTGIYIVKMNTNKGETNKKVIIE